MRSSRNNPSQVGPVPHSGPVLAGMVIALRSQVVVPDAGELLMPLLQCWQVKSFPASSWKLEYCSMPR